MDRIIISLVAFFLSAWSLSAQITITNANFPAAGDTLRIAIDTTSAGITVSPPGGGQTWEFMGLTAIFVRTIPFSPASESPNGAAFPTATLTGPAGPNGDNFYQVTATTYSLVGFAGNDPIGFGLNVQTPFNPPVVERRAPMNFFDVNQTNGALLVPFAASELPQVILDLLPITPDSIRLRVALNRVDVVDGWGTLSIPGGTYEVLRERRTQYSDTRIEVKVGAFPWVDVTQLIPLPDAGLGRDTTLTYNFFSNSAKEPIAIVAADHITGEVLSVQYKFNGIIANSGDVVAMQPGVALWPNPASDKVRVEISSLPAGRYFFQLFSINGQFLQRHAFDGGGEAVTVLDVALAGISPGMHAYALTDSAGNVLKTGRLIVISGK